MRHYFKLQFKILQRILLEIGLPLWLLYLILPFSFFLGSYFLFELVHFKYLAFAYALLPFFPIIRLQNIDRQNFLKNLYSRNQYLKIRISENILIALPFLIILLFKQEYLASLICLSLTFVLTTVTINQSLDKALTTPFYKSPFEFIAGFRKSIILFPLVYAILIIGIIKDNFNLSLSSLFIQSLIGMSFYNKPDNKYLVWIHKHQPKSFLFHKLKIAFRHFSWLNIPVVLTLCIYQPNAYYMIIISLILCYLFLSLIVLAKYAAFPEDINMAQGILLAISIAFPPFTLVLIFHFYKKAIHQLTPVLTHDSY